ncbi:MAG: propanediol dehydratase, partial [Anaerolineae bacterium]|nr:propanediol dehydratase [Anaerolineae bacterium]
MPQAWNPREFVEELECQVCAPWLEDVCPAAPGTAPEVVIAIGPAFGTGIQQALSELDLRDVLAAMVRGVADEGLDARIVRIHHTSDCAFIGHAGAQLSGSGVAIGIQSRGTTVIHQRDLEPL